MVGRVHFQVRTLQLVILFADKDQILHWMLLIKTLLIYGIFGHIGFDNMHFTQMPSTCTV